jgi:hypothetical protein
VRHDPCWYFARLDRPVATWITPDRLEEQARLLPAIAYRRLWLNEWTAGGGDALAPELIAAAFDPSLRPQTRAAAGYEYVAGIDAGVTRDATAVCVLAVRRSHEGHGRVRLAATRVWRPGPGRKVHLQEVEHAILDLHDAFNFRQVNYDPWEMRHLASRLQAAGLGRWAGEPKFGRQRREAVPMVEVTPTGKNLQAMATAVLEAFHDRRLELYEEADLRRDLSRMRVEERAYGFRLTSPRDERGHGDLGTAFSLALLAAGELAGKKLVAAGPLTDDDHGDTALSRAMRRLDRNAAAFARDQEHYLAGEDHGAEFRRAMQRAGRVHSPFF